VGQSGLLSKVIEPAGMPASGAGAVAAGGPGRPEGDGPDRGRPAVVTIGSFDGVHLGHAALIARARQLAATLTARTGRATPIGVTAMVFDPHPMTGLSAPGHGRAGAAGGVPPRLSSFRQRECWLSELGCDGVVRLLPEPAVLGLSPAEFVRWCVQRHGAAGFVEGSDFRFGRARAGGVEELAALAGAAGLPVEVVPPVEVVLSDHQTARASSTLARWLVAHGRVRDAAAVLGRWFELDAAVVPGDRRGRGLGFPTANLQPRVEPAGADEAVLPPGDGVYACLAALEDGRVLPAAVNVGRRPTFAGVARTVEAHLLGLSTSMGAARGRWAPLPGLGEYGWNVRLRFVGWLRDQLRFDSPEALVAQLGRDCRRAAEVLSRDAGAAVAGGTILGRPDAPAAPGVAEIS
jgi:riboflavin kinase/FMN adenylyltransferase